MTRTRPNVGYPIANEDCDWWSVEVRSHDENYRRRRMIRLEVTEGRPLRTTVAYVDTDVPPALAEQLRPSGSASSGGGTRPGTGAEAKALSFFEKNRNPQGVVTPVEKAAT